MLNTILRYIKTLLSGNPLVNVMILYALTYLGRPYIWGALDCSGFAQKVLAVVGKDPIKDQTALRLYEIYKARGEILKEPKRGCLVFFKGSNKVGHVAIALGSKYMIEAGGGNHRCDTVRAADYFGACVRIVPINRRSDIVAYIDPFN